MLNRTISIRHLESFLHLIIRCVYGFVWLIAQYLHTRHGSAEIIGLQYRINEAYSQRCLCGGQSQTFNVDINYRLASVCAHLNARVFANIGYLGTFIYSIER